MPAFYQNCSDFIFGYFSLIIQVLQESDYSRCAYLLLRLHLQYAAVDFCSCFKYSASSPSLKWLFCVLKITISLSIAVMLLFLIFSDFIANHIFMESRCEGIIRITAISLPFMCIHNCLSNYYYSQKESFLPASSQLVEQLVRIGTIILYVRIKMYQQYQLLTQLPVIYSVNLQLPHTVLFRCFSVPFIIKA